MATSSIIIPGLNGRIDAVNPAAPAVAYDTNSPKLLMQHAKPSNNDTDAHFCFYLPANYLSGAMTIKIRWRTTGNSGKVRWSIFYAGKVTGNVLTGTPTTLSDSPGTAVPGTASFWAETTLSIASPAADTMYFFVLRRVGSDTTNDTQSATAEVDEISFSYTSDSGQTKCWLWIPANVLLIPSSSGATLTQRNVEDVTPIVHPYAIDLPETAGTQGIIQARFLLPSNFSANLKTQLVFASSGTGNFVLRMDMAKISVGGSTDPAFTSGTNQTVTGAGTNNLNVSAVQTAPITPAAQDEVLMKLTRFSQDAADTAVTDAYLYGILVSYDSYNKNPVVQRLDPQSGAAPLSGGAALVRIVDTNSEKVMVQYANAVTQSYFWGTRLPGNYASGGTARVRWRTNAAGGYAALRAYVASPALGAASDPSMTQISPDINAANAGALKENETTFDVSPGLASDDELVIQIMRLGGSDTLGDTCEIMEVHFESAIL